MSRREYELSPDARLDLALIWNYLAEHASIDVADRIINDIESAIPTLVGSPHLGHRRTDLAGPEFLFHRVHSYFVVYHATLEPLRVIRILHMSRNVKRILGE